METVHADLIRHATPDDETEFLDLWTEYLVEHEKAGSLIAASEMNLVQFRDVWRQIVRGQVEGLSLIVPKVAVNLWGPASTFEMVGGRLMPGLGSYVRPAFRRAGIGAALYERGFQELRARGYRYFAGAVHAGNALGERNALRLESRVLETVRVVEL